MKAFEVAEIDSKFCFERIIAGAPLILHCAPKSKNSGDLFKDPRKSRLKSFQAAKQHPGSDRGSLGLKALRLEAFEWMGNLVFLSQHFVSRRLSLHRVGDSVLSCFVVVLVDLGIVFSSWVNENAANDH